MYIATPNHIKSITHKTKANEQYGTFSPYLKFLINYQ